MGASSRRQKETGWVDQKWEYISLNDFKARGCGPGFAYFWLWLMLLVSVAVYAVDSFVAVNLLILDKWSSKIEPPISYDVSKWVFSACIILSFINLGFEAWRAYRVIKRGNVAESYLDPLAVRWESIRMGSGQGWKRFLVFAELTKSKKGAEYSALFTYFSLTAWVRVLICSGPRQVINAFTFKSVYESKLTVSSPSVEGSLAGFGEKIAALYDEDNQQALILAGMAFTFVIWVFSLIFLITAVLIYVTFLCHWIPRSDGGLRGYCERKVNQTLTKIVTEKVNRALAKGDADRMKAQFKAAKTNGEPPQMERMATLPTLPNVGPTPGPPSTKGTEDSLPAMPVLGRSETTSTLPAYSSRPASPGAIEMGAMGRMAPTRTGTMASTNTDRTYSSKASLLGSAADMGVSSPGVGAYGQHPNGRPPPGRQFNPYAEGRSSPAPSSLNPRPTPQPRFNNAYADSRAGSPAPGGPPYQRSATGPPPPRGPQHLPQRNVTAPMSPQYPQGYDRAGTPQSQRGGPNGYYAGSQRNNGYGY